MFSLVFRVGMKEEIILENAQSAATSLNYTWNFQNVILFKQDFKNVDFMVLKVVKSYESIWIAILRTY